MNRQNAQQRVAPRARKERVIHVIQGDMAISADPNTVLSTVLGSCVAVCMRDPIAAIGGMNHFLLPSGPDGRSDDQKYGVHAMECLINSLLRQGARRGALEAKVFGGARVVDVGLNIGEKNVTFIEKFLSAERIPCVSSSVGGDRGRRVRFWPVTGAAKQMLLEPTAKLPDERPAPTAPADGGDLELF